MASRTLAFARRIDAQFPRPSSPIHHINDRPSTISARLGITFDDSPLRERGRSSASVGIIGASHKPLAGLRRTDNLEFSSSADRTRPYNILGERRSRQRMFELSSDIRLR